MHLIEPALPDNSQSVLSIYFDWKTPKKNWSVALEENCAPTILLSKQVKSVLRLMQLHGHCILKERLVLQIQALEFFPKISSCFK